MRASGWNRIPLIRMTNVSLEPGEWTLEDMIADTDDGIYMETNRSWSIDDRRLNFQFGTEIGARDQARQARRPGEERDLHRHHAAVLGQLRRRRATATGGWSGARRTAARGSRSRWRTPATAPPPARFRNVQVGLMK